eukprot:scaffold84917_cov19-Tisochrysis_lutea.AAC.1
MTLACLICTACLRSFWAHTHALPSFPALKQWHTASLGHAAYGGAWLSTYAKHGGGHPSTPLSQLCVRLPCSVPVALWAKPGCCTQSVDKGHVLIVLGMAPGVTSPHTAVRVPPSQYASGFLQSRAAC